MIGQYIRKQRLARGIQLRDMCRKLGIDASNYSKFERGKIRSIELLEKVAEYIFVLTDSEDYKLWYTAIAASRQKEHTTYDYIVRDCIYTWNIQESKKALLLQNQWIARAKFDGDLNVFIENGKSRIVEATLAKNKSGKLPIQDI